MFSVSGFFSAMQTALRSRRLHLLCRRFSDVAKDLPSGEETFFTDEEGRKFKKKTTPQIVDPQPRDGQALDWNSVIGINIAASTVSWASVSLPDIKITNVGLLEWGSYQKRAAPSELLESAISIAGNIPPASLYVFNKSIWKRRGELMSIGFLNTIIFGSMLTTLLNGTNQPEENGHKVFYLENFSFSKLYQLRVGDEEISSQHVVHNMLLKSGDGLWLPHVYGVNYLEDRKETPYSIPKWAGVAIERLWVRDDVRRENMCNAVLLSLAFIDLIYLGHPSALKMMVKTRSPKKTKKNSTESEQGKN